MKKSHKKIIKSTGVVGFFTLLSRFFGFIRDFVIAWFFGANLKADAFFVAFRIPNLLRRLFAEGSLTIAFIPIFTEYIQNKGKEEAFKMVSSFFYVLSFILVLVSIAGILCAKPIVSVMAPGFIGSPEKFEITVLLTKIMFPYVLLICLVALSMGVLNVLGHFAAPSLAPLFLNISIIFSAFFVAPHLKEPVLALAFGVLCGGVLQLALQVPFLLKKKVYFWRCSSLFHPALKRISKLMLPAVVGSAVYQINIVVGTMLASTLPEGSISYLYYADRIVQFPLAIFAISLSTAILPDLSKYSAQKDIDTLKKTFSYGIKVLLFMTIPAMIGLIVLREPIIKLLFQRGAFSLFDAKMTSSALLCYLVGLWAFALVRVFVAMFYALQDTKTPVKIAIISIIFNIIISFILMKYLFHNGLALATSLSSILNLCMLSYALKKKIGNIDMISILKSAYKILASACLMGVTIFYFQNIVMNKEALSFPILLFGVLSMIALGSFLYFLFAYLFKSPELKGLLSMIQNRKKSS